MRSSFFVLPLALTAYSILFAQTPGVTSSSSPHFEVASLKLSPPNAAFAQRRDPGRIEMRNAGLGELLWEAYRVWGYQVVYPRDFANRRYDLEATLSPDAPAGQRQQMFQNLLAERLRLLAHEESRELRVYAITVANQGIRMPRAELDPNTHPYDFPIGATITDGEKHVLGKISIPYLPLTLQADLDLPLVDFAGIKDVYQVDLRYTAMLPATQRAGLSQDELGALRVSVVASLVSAMERQLGLHVDARKAPVRTLVIDRVSSEPTGN